MGKYDSLNLIYQCPSCKGEHELEYIAVQPEIKGLALSNAARLLYNCSGCKSTVTLESIFKNE